LKKILLNLLILPNINYIVSGKSKSTLYQMPNLNLINKYIMKCGYGGENIFVSITWIFPILSLIISEKLIYNFSN